MEVKALNEIKNLIKQNPKAGGIGFAIAMPLFKIAHDLGLPGYGFALAIWMKNQIRKVFTTKEPIEDICDDFIVTLSYEGLPIRIIDRPLLVRRVEIGIKETIQMINRCLKPIQASLKGTVKGTVKKERGRKAK